MAIQGPVVSMTDLENEFGKAGYLGSNTLSIELENYYRGGGLVPNLSYNQNIPSSGEISLSDFIGGRGDVGTIYGTTTVPRFVTDYFKIGNAVRTYRVVHAFGITQNTRFSFSTSFSIRGDTRDPNTLASTNSQHVEFPRIALYVNGNAADGVTEPSGVKILEGASNAVSYSEDVWADVDMNESNPPGVWAPAFSNVYVVYSMICTAYGPDAPQSRWYGEEFKINLKIG